MLFSNQTNSAKCSAQNQGTYAFYKNGYKTLLPREKQENYQQVFHTF